MEISFFFQAAHVLKIKQPCYLTYHTNTGRRGNQRDTADHYFSNDVHDILTDLGVESSSKRGPKPRQRLQKVSETLRDLNCSMRRKCCLNNETPIMFRASYFSIVFPLPPFLPPSLQLRSQARDEWTMSGCCRSRKTPPTDGSITFRLLTFAL